MRAEAGQARDDFAQVVQDQCLAAHIHGTPLSDDAARLIASVFACTLPDRSALHRFALGEPLEPEALRAEMTALRTDGRLNAVGEGLLDWLAGYLLAVTSPELAPDAATFAQQRGTHTIEHHGDLDMVVALHSRSTSPLADPESLRDAATALICEYGLPMLAYLRLPAVDAADPHLGLRFQMAFSGSWPTVGDLLADYFRALRDAKPARAFPDVPYRELTPEDQTLLRLQLGSGHQVVEASGLVHLLRREG